MIGYVSARYGLGLDETTTALIAGGCVLLGSYLMRLVTKQPVAGIVATPAGTPPALPTPGNANLAAVLLLVCVAAVLSACTSAQVNTALSDGQLACAVGPTVVKLVDQTGAPVLAKDATAGFVKAACLVIGGIAVSPPSAPVPTVTINPPPATIKLSEK